MKKVLVDMRDLIDILFYDAFKKMGLDLTRIKLIQIPLIGFLKKCVLAEEIISLFVVMGIRHVSNLWST